jgi:nitrogen PTS system EIIA component
MEIADLLAPDRVVLDLRPRDKTQLIAELARIAATHVPDAPATAIEAALSARERLGSTGLGSGFALPHARLEGLRQFVGLFARLARPIDFQAIDAKPVDLLFLLLIPAEASDHVGALAAVSRRFREPAIAGRLRKATSPAIAFGVLTEH